MTVSYPVRARIAPIGVLFLAVPSIGWGLNWPVMKFLLTELPPLTTRGFTGVVGAVLLAGLAVARGDDLRVPRQAWAPLVVLALLNVSGWSALIGVALLWLSGGEAAVLACTMPVLASLLAFWILGERMSLRRILAMLMAFAGIVALMGGVGISASLQKLSASAACRCRCSAWRSRPRISRPCPGAPGRCSPISWRCRCVPPMSAGSRR